MPKFNGQNKKRNNPRYFLNETAEKEEIKEEEDSWEKYDDLMAKAGASGEEWQAPWNSTEEMIDKLADQAREASKAVNGYKVDVEGMTISQLRDLLHSMGNSDVQRAMDDESQREDDMATGMQDDELDNSPKHLGMGRMEEEKLKESIERELSALLLEIDDQSGLQPPEGFMALDPERFSFAKGPAGDAMASKIDKALRKAGHYDKRGADPRMPNAPATLFYGEMVNGKKCDGRYGFCESDEIAQALLALPETRGLFSADERLNSAIVHALNIELGDAFEDHPGIGRAIASRIGDADAVDTYGQPIDPRAAALQRIREAIAAK